MALRTRILGVALGLAALVLVPAAAPAQFFHPGVIHAQAAFRHPALFNGLANGYLNNLIASRALHSNAYLNQVAGNINAAYGAANGALYSNALLTNAFLGNTNPAVVNTLGNAVANNVRLATNFYTNAYFNHALSNVARYSAHTNSLLYNSLTPNYAFARYNTLVNPYTGSVANYAAITNPYGTFYNVAATRLHPFVGGYNPYMAYRMPNLTAMYNGYPNPYVGYTPYAAPYTSYFNPYTYMTPYASYVNPYNNFVNPYSNFVNPYAYNPYSVLYNPYLYTPGSTLYSPYGAPSAAGSNIYTTAY
jgi:hypothetical protein